MGLSMRASEF